MREDWKEVRIKDIAKLIGSGSTPLSGKELYYNNGTIPWINTGDLNDNFILENKKNITELAIKDYPILKFYNPQTIIIALYGATIGKLGILTYRATVNQACCCISLYKNYNFKYLFYSLYAGKNKLIENSLGGTQPNISQKTVANTLILLPPLHTQHAIATYLDKKLFAIDRQIALLEKKRDRYAALRKSLINQTVCHGLNPDVEMKESGIAWLGKIPKHWEVRRMKDLSLFYFTGFTPETETLFETVGDSTWITIGDMQNKIVDSSNINISAETARKRRQPITVKGSLLFSFKLSIGKVAFAGKDLYTNEAIISIRPTKKVSFEYLYYILPIALLNHATENIYGAKMLNQKIINNMLLNIPPLSEQRAIAAYLDKQSEKIDAITANINSRLNRLTQLKKSLINECVTGARVV